MSSEEQKPVETVDPQPSTVELEHALPREGEDRVQPTRPAVPQRFARFVRGQLHQLAAQTWRNPVVIKEVRGRMRGWRATVVLTAHLIVLSCFASIIYFAISQSVQAMGTTTSGQMVGQTLFYSSYMLLLTVVAFLSPAFTAGAISGERERKSLELLITTLLPTRSLVLGKLISALAYIVLLILAALPIQSLAFMFGGVILSEVIIGTSLLLVTALLAGSIGLFVSSWMRSSIASTVVTYAVILVTAMGLPLVILILFSFLGILVDPLLTNLDWVPQAMLIYVAGFLLCTNPFATAVATKLVANEQNTFFFFTTQIQDRQGISHTLPLVSPWLVYTLLYIVVSILLILLSVAILERKRG